MPAQLLKPRTGDTLKVPAGGNAAVSVYHNYAVMSNLQCFVDADHDASVPLNGTGTHGGSVPCSKGAGTYLNVPVHVETNGSTDDTQTVTKRVLAAAVVPTSARVNPPLPAVKPAAGITIQYLIRGDLEPNTAYVVCAVHEMTANPADAPVLVDGVFAFRRPDGTWGGLVTVPNRAQRAYIARIIEFDANDQIVIMQTEVLD